MQTKLIYYLLRFLGILPLWLTHGLGHAIGWLLYRIPNRERHTARVNLELCFPELSGHERDKMLGRVLRESVITLLEMPAVWFGDTDRWLQRLDMGQVRAEIERLLTQGKGLIIAMPHLGNFEISAHFFGSIGPATGLYRPPRKQGLESVMLEGRNRPGKNRMVPTDMQGIKALYQALEANEMIVILPDQQPKAQKGGVGVFAPFFNVPALTMTLVNRFARKTGAPVYFVSFVRIPKKPGYQVIGVPATEDIAARDQVAAANALNQGVEASVRRYPDQYQWTYRRFEAQPDGGLSPYKRIEGREEPAS